MNVRLLFWVILSFKAWMAYTDLYGYDFIFDLDSSSEQNHGDDLRIADSCTWQRGSIKCDASKGWPSFQKIWLDTKYATPGSVNIIGDVSTIPAHALAPFNSIKHLALELESGRKWKAKKFEGIWKIDSVQPLKWDKDAFTGITVEELTIKNVVGTVSSLNTRFFS